MSPAGAVAPPASQPPVSAPAGAGRGGGWRGARCRPLPSVPPEERRAAAAGGRQRPVGRAPGRGSPSPQSPTASAGAPGSLPLAGAFPGVGDRMTLRGDVRFAASRAAAERCPAGRCAPPPWPRCRGQRSGDPARRRKAARRPYFQQPGVPSRAGHRRDDFGKRHRAVLAVLWPHHAERNVFSLRVCSLPVSALLSPAARVCGSRLTAVTLTRDPDTVCGSSRAPLVERGLY